MWKFITATAFLALSVAGDLLKDEGLHENTRNGKVRGLVRDGGHASRLRGKPAKRGLSILPICHKTGNGEFILIEVSPNSFERLMALGDAAPFDPVPGMEGVTFDAECNLVMITTPVTTTPVLTTALPTTTVLTTALPTTPVLTTALPTTARPTTALPTTTLTTTALPTTALPTTARPTTALPTTALTTTVLTTTPLP